MRGSARSRWDAFVVVPSNDMQQLLRVGSDSGTGSFAGGSSVRLGGEFARWCSASVMRARVAGEGRALRRRMKAKVSCSGYGLLAPATSNLHRNRPVVNGQLLHFIHHGRVHVTPGIQRFDGHDVHFTDGTVRTIDTILYATGFKAILDPTLLQMADGVPLRVGGMTLPVGLERLYFVGLAAPRGPQLPVYSAQARLIAKFLTAQERSGFALSAIHAKASRPEARIDIPRHEWQRDMDRTLRRTCRILRRTPTRASAPQPSRDSLAIPA